jgi:aspartyl protease family protein
MTKKLVIIITNTALLLAIQTSFAIDKIVINGLFKDKAVVTIDGKQRILKKNKPSPEGVLLLESNSKEAVIEIDGQQDTYKLGSHIGNTFKPPTDNDKLVIAPDASGMYNISGMINGFHVPFIVDTGATLVSMNSNIAKKLGIDYKLKGKESQSYTASGKSKIHVVNLKRVKVGDIELHNVKGAVHEGDFPVVTLLGMSFLNQLEMKREGQIMELQKKY